MTTVSSTIVGRYDLQTGTLICYAVSDRGA
jgi:hypothetical protein